MSDSRRERNAHLFDLDPLGIRPDRLLSSLCRNFRFACAALGREFRQRAVDLVQAIVDGRSGRSGRFALLLLLLLL